MSKSWWKFWARWAKAFACLYIIGGSIIVLTIAMRGDWSEAALGLLMVPFGAVVFCFVMFLLWLIEPEPDLEQRKTFWAWLIEGW